MSKVYLVNIKRGSFEVAENVSSITEKVIDGKDYYVYFQPYLKEEHVIMTKDVFTSKTFQVVRAWKNYSSEGTKIEYVGSFSDCLKIRDDLVKEYRLIKEPTHDCWVEMVVANLNKDGE